MDPLNVVARSHEIVLWSRVFGFPSGYLEQLIYQERRFFDYGGGLFVYPMEELPYWQLHMQQDVGRKAGGQILRLTSRIVGTGALSAENPRAIG